MPCITLSSGKTVCYGEDTNKYPGGGQTVKKGPGPFLIPEARTQFKSMPVANRFDPRFMAYQDSARINQNSVRDLEAFNKAANNKQPYTASAQTYDDNYNTTSAANKSTYTNPRNTKNHLNPSKSIQGLTEEQRGVFHGGFNTADNGTPENLPTALYSADVTNPAMYKDEQLWLPYHTNPVQPYHVEGPEPIASKLVGTIPNSYDRPLMDPHMQFQTIVGTGYTPKSEGITIPVPTVEITQQTAAPRSNAVLKKNVVNPKSRTKTNVHVGIDQREIMDRNQLDSLRESVGLEPKGYKDGGKSKFNFPVSKERQLAEQARIQGDIAAQNRVLPKEAVKANAVAKEKIKQQQERKAQEDFYNKGKTELNEGEADTKTAMERKLLDLNLGFDELEQQGNLAPGLRDFQNMGGLEKGLFLMGSAFEPMGNKAGFVKNGKFVPTTPQFEHLSQRLASEYRNGVNRPLTEFEVEQLNHEFNTHGRLLEHKNKYGDFIGELFYKGVKPEGYGFKDKVKQFIPNIKNFNQDDRIFQTGERFDQGYKLLKPNQKSLARELGNYPQQGINRENSFRLGLGLPQLQLKEQNKTFEVSPFSTTEQIMYKPRLSALNHYANVDLLKSVPSTIGVQNLISTGNLEGLSKRYGIPFKSLDEAKLHYLVKEEGFSPEDAVSTLNDLNSQPDAFKPASAVYKNLPDGKVRINDADGYFSIMGGFPWISDPINKKYTAEDTWDLQPFKKRDMIFKHQSGKKEVTNHPLPMLKNLELLKMMGGTPFKTKFELEESPNGSINYKEEGGKNNKTITLSTGKIVTLK